MDGEVIYPSVHVVNITVFNNPTSATNPFQFEIIFESKSDLPDGEIPFALMADSEIKWGGIKKRLIQVKSPSCADLEWKVLYVGDYRTSAGDQVSDPVLVGPVTRGTHKFLLQVRTT